MKYENLHVISKKALPLQKNRKMKDNERELFPFVIFHLPIFLQR
jgi:hypothetical protein